MGLGVGGVGYNKMEGEAAWNVSVEVVTSNSPGTHLKLLPGSFFPLNVASALSFFYRLPTTSLHRLTSLFLICHFLTVFFSTLQEDTSGPISSCTGLRSEQSNLHFTG